MVIQCYSANIWNAVFVIEKKVHFIKSVFKGVPKSTNVNTLIRIQR